MNTNPNTPERIKLSKHLEQLEDALTYNSAHISALRKFLANQGFEKIERKYPSPKIEMWNLTGKLLCSGYTHALICTNFVIFSHSHHYDKTFIYFDDKTPKKPVKSYTKLPAVS